MARGETQASSLALGANREGKERIEDKASRIQSSRMCVRQSAQHRELKLSDSAQFVLITVVMVAVSTCGPAGCPVIPPPLSSQNIQSHEKSPTSHRARGGTKAMTLALGANCEGKERVEGKASRIQSSRTESAHVCVSRNVHHLELKLSDFTRFVLMTVVIVAVFASGPTGCLLSPPHLSSQNVQSHIKAPTSHATESEVKHKP